MLRKIARPLLGAVLALGVTAGAAVIPTAASAQTVYCTNCASQLTQLKQQADQALQLVRQAEQLQTQISSYQNMLQNTARLPEHIFGDAMRDINQLKSIYDQAKGLVYTASNLDEQFAARYGNFDSYKQAGISDARLQEKYRQWSNESNDSVLTTMRGLGLHERQLRDDAATLQRLQQHASSADGQMQALSAGNEYAAFTAGQMQRLHQLVMMQVNMQASALQIEADRNAVGAARAREFFSGSTPTYSGNTY